MIVRYECTCETCGTDFIRRRSDKLPVPRFCSNKCKFITTSKERTLKRVEKTFACYGCGVQVTLLLKEHETRQYCTHSCAAKHMYLIRGHKPMVTYTLNCELCGAEFSRTKKQSDPVPRFCSKRCSTSANARTSNGYDAYYARLLKRYDEETAKQIFEEHKARRSASTIKYNTGRHLDASSRKKISETLKDGYATGRVQINAGSHHRPVYRDVKLRSFLERAAVQILESDLGVELGKDLTYEKLRFQYVNIEGEKRTYVPDLYHVASDTVIEVKPHYLSIRESYRPKELAVIAAGHKFRYFTEKDVVKWCEDNNVKLGKRFEIDWSSSYQASETISDT